MNLYEDHTQKRVLAKTLNISERSIYNYQALAMIYIDDYSEDFPVIDNLRYTKAPLSPYQCWVIELIHKTLKVLSSKKVFTKQLEADANNQAFYSKATFLSTTEGNL